MIYAPPSPIIHSAATSNEPTLPVFNWSSSNLLHIIDNEATRQCHRIDNAEHSLNRPLPRVTQPTPPSIFAQNDSIALFHVHVSMSHSTSLTPFVLNSSPRTPFSVQCFGSPFCPIRVYIAAHFGSYNFYYPLTRQCNLVPTSFNGCATPTRPRSTTASSIPLHVRPINLPNTPLLPHPMYTGVSFQKPSPFLPLWLWWHLPILFS